MATDSIPNSNRSFRCLQWSIPHRTFLKCANGDEDVCRFQEGGEERGEYLLIVAFLIDLAEFVVTAVSVAVPFGIHLVTLLVASFARIAPK